MFCFSSIYTFKKPLQERLQQNIRKVYKIHFTYVVHVLRVFLKHKRRPIVVALLVFVVDIAFLCQKVFMFVLIKSNNEASC